MDVTMVQSSGAAESKLNTMIATNSLPDVLMLDRGADVERLQQAGVLVSLDEFVDKYPNLKEQAGEATLNMLRSTDGKLYQFPDWYTSSPNGNGGYMINKKIYKELGSPKLETFDELEEYLKLVKEKYPNVIPLEVGTQAAGVHIMYSGFEENSPYNAPPMAKLDGDQLKSIYQDEQFKENMMLASRLFRDKLITQDALTQTDDMVKEKLKTGRVAVFASYDVANYGRDANNALQQTDPDAGYEVIWPIHKEGLDVKDIKPLTYNTLGWNVLVITKNAKDPEAIFAYLDWLTGEEGQRVIWFGPPGLYWDEVDEQGYPIMNEKGKAASKTEKDEQLVNTHNWAGNSKYTGKAKIFVNELLPSEQQDWATNVQSNIIWHTSKDITEFMNINPIPDSEEGIVLTALNDLHTETFAKLLFAKSDQEVEKLLADAHNDAIKIGYDKILAYWTERWHENRNQMAQ